MKRKISAVVLGFSGLLACSCFVTAGELSAFDTAYINPKEAVKSTASNIALPVVSQGTVNKAVSIAEQPARIVVMKDLLLNIPASDRSEFFDSLVLKNGRIVSADLAPLKRTLLEDDMDAVVKTIFYRSENDKSKIKNTGLPARYADISKLLAGVSQDVKNNFLGSLMFKDGYFVSAQIGELSGVVASERLDEIIKAIATTPGSLSTFSPKTLCGDGVCYKAHCYSPDASKHYCKDHKTSVCDSSCHDY